jgi:hybrid cluster-associated redox disulfide protein
MKRSKTKDIIKPDMSLGEIAGRWPEVVPIMYKYGLHCPTCPVAAAESLEAGAAAHGLTKKQIQKMIKEMNKVIK